MSPIVVREHHQAEKATYKDQDGRNNVKFPNLFEVVPPVQFRLYSLYEVARQKLN
jgi:hypothetical protein